MMRDMVFLTYIFHIHNVNDIVWLGQQEAPLINELRVIKMRLIRLMKTTHVWATWNNTFNSAKLLQ